MVGCPLELRVIFRRMTRALVFPRAIGVSAPHPTPIPVRTSSALLVIIQVNGER
jgi:hypothetical protein